MGTVYLARDLADGGREVALKMLKGRSCTGSQAKARFEVEARALAEVKHPNVVRFVDAGAHLDSPYLVMEHVSGPSLRQHVAQHGPLDPWVAVQLACHVGRGLSAVHAHGIVHRDVKSSNIMLLMADGTPFAAKVTDLGLARLPQQQLTARGVRMGTAAYMAPEQVVGDPVDTRTDVFGLGMTLVFMLCGKVPTEPNPMRQAALRLMAPSPSLTSCSEQAIPIAIQRIVRRALRKRPENRYQTMAAMVRDLETLLGHHAKAAANDDMLSLNQDASYQPSTEHGHAYVAAIADFFEQEVQLRPPAQRPGTNTTAEDTRLAWAKPSRVETVAPSPAFRFKDQTRAIA